MDNMIINQSQDTFSVMSTPIDSKRSISETTGLNYDQAIDRAGGLGNSITN